LPVPTTTRTPASDASQDTEARKLQHTMIEQEQAHRSRLARMRRLEQVYRERGDRQKLAQLDEIQNKEHTRYGRWVEAQQVKLGRARYDKMQTALARGRERGQPRERVVAQREREHAAAHANDATREHNIELKHQREQEAARAAEAASHERPKPVHPAGHPEHPGKPHN
jgi:hypothetical protein